MVAALIALGLVWLAPQDPFVAQRDAAAALNPLSPRFTIAVDGNRRPFRVGERIPLVFIYDGIRNRSVLDERPYTHFATAVLDRREGAADPDADFARARLYISGGVCGCVEGGVVGGVGTVGLGVDAEGRPFLLAIPPTPPPTPPPVKVRFVLNDGVRFDVPGHYRLYMEDRHDEEGVGEEEPRPAPLVSDILELDILGPDEGSDDRTLRDAVAVLDASSDPDTQQEAARTIRFLGTRRAIDAMARRLYRGTQTREADIELEAGLFAARHRAYAIARVQAEADNPLRPVSLLYLRTLAALRVTQTTTGTLRPADKRRAFTAAEARRTRALARAGRRDERLLAPALDRAWAIATRAPGGSADTGPYLSIQPDTETGRDVHVIRHARISPATLRAEVSGFPRGMSFVWQDDRDFTLESWYVDLDEEFRRAGRVLRLQGMSLSRR